MEHFYLFELQIKYHFKFGMTTKYDPMERLNEYQGLNKPSRIIKIFAVADGCLEEKRFCEFLKQNNISFFAGKEFFYYDRDIDTLLDKYFQNKDTIIINQKHSYKRMVYKPGYFVLLSKVKKTFTSENISTFIKSYNIQKKVISVCRKCEQKANKKCCICKDGYDGKNRTKNMCLLDMCIK